MRLENHTPPRVDRTNTCQDTLVAGEEVAYLSCASSRDVWLLAVTRTVYKIVSESEWREACRAGAYRGSADDLRDGFIHLSSAEQIEGTAIRHFHNRTGLIIVAFDAEALGEALRFEPSRDGALFPHYFGELPTALALWEKPMFLDADGVPRIVVEAS